MTRHLRVSAYLAAIFSLLILPRSGVYAQAAPGLLARVSDYTASPFARFFEADASLAGSGQYFLVGADVGFPASYDLRSLGLVTFARDQSPYGTCWAHSALASLESTELKRTATTLDLSEWHLAWYGYNDFSPELVGFTRRSLPTGADTTFDQGGDAWRAVALLARGTGAVSESAGPYQHVKPYPASSIPKGNETNTITLQQAFFLGSSPVTSDIKTALMNYGAVGANIYWDENYYDGIRYSYRYVSGDSINHGVDIVGWNDQYSKSLFPSGNQPANDGAWIVRNHQGPAWGEVGYFYLSYDSLLKNGMVFLSGPVIYDHIYQYDALGATDGYALSSDRQEGWLANVFVAQANERIQAVSFYTTAANTQYEILVNAGQTKGEPLANAVIHGPQTGTLGWPGYQTIALTKNPVILAGQQFSIIVKLSSDISKILIPVENPIIGYSEKARANPGESYVSLDGVEWSDMTGLRANTNVCLKAFTVDAPGPIISKIVPTQGLPGTRITLTGAYLGEASVQLATVACDILDYSDSWINAVVPQDALSGVIRVITPVGQTTSEISFRVLGADLNGDGTIDVADLAQLAASFGKGSETVDLNGDGVVDETDISLWLNYF